MGNGRSVTDGGDGRSVTDDGDGRWVTDDGDGRSVTDGGVMRGVAVEFHRGGEPEKFSGLARCVDCGGSVLCFAGVVAGFRMVGTDAEASTDVRLRGGLLAVREMW